MIDRLLLGVALAWWGFGWYVVADAYEGSVAAGLVATLLWVAVGVPVAAALREFRRR